LEQFFLVGGTALAMHIGHRLSIDLDLFSRESFDTNELETHLARNYAFNTDYLASNTLKGFIDNIKIDFITHAYDLFKPVIHVQGFRLASVEDIGAMKLNAIAHSGNRQKDFFYLYFILEHMSLAMVLQAYEVKYPQSNPMIPLKGLTYFDDIDFAIERPMLKRKATFQQVKGRLIRAEKSPREIFQPE